MMLDEIIFYQERQLLNRLDFIPTYEVINKERLDKDTYRITLVNIDNDFDVIRIKVPSYAKDMIFRGNNYSINSRIKRTWYTLWLGKKEEYYVLGNVNKEGQVTITTASLSDKAIEELKEEWDKTYYNQSLK